MQAKTGQKWFWQQESRYQSQLPLAVKKVLRIKVKAELKEILDEEMEQAEPRYKEYDMSVAQTKKDRPK